MNYHVITLFPQAFDSYLNESILKRAIEDKKIKVKFYNPRDFTKGTSYADRRVDDRPYGGGPGMVIEALPVMKAIAKAVGKKKKVKIIFFAPAGKLADTLYVQAIAKKYTDIVFVCGRYEGIDARVKKAFKMEDISVGPYVLTGGELPAMLLIDTISRQVDGVLGDINSLEESRVAAHDVYTRPETVEFKGKKYKVPAIVLSGDHAKIEAWKASTKPEKVEEVGTK
jgi:tRNA (guanine37-N1)-methyltransferase